MNSLSGRRGSGGDRGGEETDKEARDREAREREAREKEEADKKKGGKKEKKEKKGKGGMSRRAPALSTASVISRNNNNNNSSNTSKASSSSLLSSSSSVPSLSTPPPSALSRGPLSAGRASPALTVSAAPSSVPSLHAPSLPRALPSPTKGKPRLLTLIVNFCARLESRNLKTKDDFSLSSLIKLKILKANHTVLDEEPPILLKILQPAAPTKIPHAAFASFVLYAPLDEIVDRFLFIELSMFKAITPQELLLTAWKIPTDKRLNVHALIDRANDVAFWVSKKIINQNTPTNRASVISRFIKIARHCAHRGSFNTLMEIMGGIDAHSVTRLKLTWDKVSSKHKSILEDLHSLISSKNNYSVYRAAVAERKKNKLLTLPYLGVYLRDFLYAHEAMSTKISETGYVNGGKMSVYSNLLSDIMYFQSQEFTQSQLLATSPEHRYFCTLRFVGQNIAPVAGAPPKPPKPVEEQLLEMSYAAEAPSAAFMGRLDEISAMTSEPECASESATGTSD